MADRGKLEEKKFKIKEKVSLETLADRLRDLIEVVDGSVERGIQIQDRHITLPPNQHIHEIELEYEFTPEESKLEFEIKWKGGEPAV